MKKFFLNKTDPRPSLEQGKIVAIDKVKGRVSLSMRNGLITAGSYLYDLNALRVGMTVLVGRVSNSNVIIDKVSNVPRSSRSYSIGKPPATVYGVGGIDVYNGKVYKSDHYNNRILVYDDLSGAYLGEIPVGDPNDYVYHPADIRVRDNTLYISFPYSSMVVSVELSEDGLGIVLETTNLYEGLSFPVGLGLNETYLYVSDVNLGNIGIYIREAPDTPEMHSFLSQSSPIGMYSLDESKQCNILACSMVTNWNNPGAFDFSLSSNSSIMRYGTVGSGIYNTTSPVGIWYYDGKVFVTDGMTTTISLEYHPINYPKVLVFDYTTGTFLYKFGVRGTGPGGFVCPTGICVYSDIVYVSDLTRGDIQKFSISGEYLGKLG